MDKRRLSTGLAKRRNREADPRLRVRVAGRRRPGIASVLPDDDPYERQRRIGRRLNAAQVR